jgi:nucleoside-diphosphate-sugar epimerase
MNILVTGATGFIGAHLVRRLVHDGHTIVALVRDPARARVLPAGVTLLAGDLSLFEDHRTVLPACDAVIHLAGVVAADDVADYHRVNYVAVQHLVACLERQSWRPKRLLFASSLAAAGPSVDGVPKAETDPCEPIEAYGRSKLDAERFLQTVSFPTTSFRPGIVFGEGDPATITLFRMAKRGLGFRLAGVPAGLSFIDVDDLVDAVTKMLADPSTAHRTYFVSHPGATDQRAMWKTLGKVMQRKVVVVPIPKPVLYVSMRAMTALAKRFRFKNQLDVKQYEQITAPAFICSSDALQRDHAWRPTQDLDASLAKAAAGFEAANWLS